MPKSLPKLNALPILNYHLNTIFVNRVGIFGLALLDKGDVVSQLLSINYKPWASPEQAPFFLTQRGLQQ